jgi:hypothetical protein
MMFFENKKPPVKTEGNSILLIFVELLVEISPPPK